MLSLWLLPLPAAQLMALMEAASTSLPLHLLSPLSGAGAEDRWGAFFCSDEKDAEDRGKTGVLMQGGPWEDGEAESRIQVCGF